MGPEEEVPDGGCSVSHGEMGDEAAHGRHTPTRFGDITGAASIEAGRVRPVRHRPVNHTMEKEELC